MTPAGAWVAVFIAIIGGLSGIAALVRTFLERPKMRADAMTLVNSAALETLTKIQEDNETTRTQLVALKLEHRKAEARIEILEDREDRYVRAMRMLVDYIAESHRIFERAHLVPPPSPLSQAEIDRLLNQIGDNEL